MPDESDRPGSEDVGRATAIVTKDPDVAGKVLPRFLIDSEIQQNARSSRLQ